MSFYEQLVAETADSRDAFLSIPLVRATIRNGASRSLYLDFLTEAYHHVRHTFPLLALAASRTADERYQDALVEYMEEERGHEKWILNDIRALGGDPDTVRDGQGGPPAGSWSVTRTTLSSISAPTHSSEACTFSRGCRYCWPTRSQMQ